MGGYSGGGALGGLMQGIVAGRELRMRLQQAADQHQQAQQAMAARDIQNRMLLSENARPVDDTGTVTQGFHAALPSTALPPELSGSFQGPKEQDISFVRPADKSRTLKYGGQSYELLTPDEQVARQAIQKRAMQEGTGVRVDPSQMGINGIAPYYADPSHLQQIFSPYLRYGQQVDPRILGGGAAAPGINGISPNPAAAPRATDTMGQMLDEPPDVTNLPMPQAPPRITSGMLPAVIRLQTNAATNQTRENVADKTQAGAAARNAASNATRTSIAAGNQASAGARADARNTTTLDAARIRRTPIPGAEAATPGQQGVQNRFDQKRLDALVKEESGYNSRRAQIGAMLASGKDATGADLNEGRKTLLRAQYRSTTDDLQGAQFRKARIMKAQAPGDAQLKAVPEGGEMTLPDGHVWRKQDGVVYIVK